MIRFLHGADFHLDSAFGALPARTGGGPPPGEPGAGSPSGGLRERNTASIWCCWRGICSTAPAPSGRRGNSWPPPWDRCEARVFISPGNHDWYGPGSPWETVDWPENVYVFKENSAHGRGGAGAESGDPRGGLLPARNSRRACWRAFTAPADGKCHIGLLHGELDGAEARYDPIRREEAAASGLCYLALGHVHKRTAPLTLGRTVCAWPGCPEGRGFDELGEKGFYEGTISDGGAGLPDLCALCPAPV